MPHLGLLTARVAESTNLMVLAGDHVRFIGSVEGNQALRVGNREDRRTGYALLICDGDRSRPPATPTRAGATSRSARPARPARRAAVR
jgi:hypothetical protein